MTRSMDDRLRELKIVPVAVLDRSEDAVPLADALVEGGLPIVEITFRTEAAQAAIESLRNRDDLLVGAGTVRTVEQAERAIGVGARFLVSPGVCPAVIEFAISRQIPIYPGTATPTDIDLATSLGLSVVKFFPAEAFGGVKTLKAICGPYPDVRFVPTGGINAGNVSDYLAIPQVLACGGSWMVSRGAVREGRFADVVAATREAVAQVAS